MNRKSCKISVLSVRLITLVLTGFGPLLQMRAVMPPPDGCYPGFTTAEGCNALALLGSGIGNTGVGWYSLFSVGDGSYNTGVGAGALALTTTGSESNTAVGTAAMLLNTSSFENTAIGTTALLYNDSGNGNTAVGAFALHDNIDGDNNIAFGPGALFKNIHASFNTAIGAQALFFNDVTGNNVAQLNTAVGASALNSNTDGDSNTAIGFAALNNNDLGRVNTAVGTGALANNDSGSGNNAFGVGALAGNTSGVENQAMGTDALEINNTGSANVAIGDLALGSNVNGSYNTVVGWHAGSSVDGDNNIYIGRSTAPGIGAESGAIRIGNETFVNACYIAGILKNGPFGADVQIDPVTGRLGSNASSKRFKRDIDPMHKTSEAIYSLKPVTFRYKNDKTNTPQFGLIAEEVAKVNPALIAVDKEGKPYTVRYNQINAMLLNEFLKEHRKMEKLEATVLEQQKQITALTTGLEKMSAQLEMNKAPRVVENTY
jgi:trimeric autotransporter adhesin